MSVNPNRYAELFDDNDDAISEAPTINKYKPVIYKKDGNTEDLICNEDDYSSVVSSDGVSQCGSNNFYFGIKLMLKGESEYRYFNSTKELSEFLGMNYSSTYALFNTKKVNQPEFKVRDNRDGKIWYITKLQKVNIDTSIKEKYKRMYIKGIMDFNKEVTYSQAEKCYIDHLIN